MLSKIFSFGSRKTGKKHNDLEAETPDEIHATKRPFPQLVKDKIRVLVFKDCDRKGKTLLFDSKAVLRDLNPQDAVQNRGIDVEQGCKRLSGGPKVEPKGNKSPMQRPKLQQPRPSHDAKMLGEMIFGSVAMTYKGQTVKVHEIRTPHQLLLTNVFAVKPRIVMPNCCDGSDYLSTSSQVDSVLDESTRIDPECASLSSQSSFSKEDSVLGTSSKPMAVPGSSPILVIDADGDSGFTASVESTYLEDNLASFFTPASSPCGSYHRRLHRSHVTSIDHSFGRKSEESSEEISPLMRRRPKLGIGIIFALGDNEEKSRALQGFFFAHFPLFESHVKRLRLAVENACFLKTKSFSSLVIEAVQAFRENIHNLIAAPRLKEPVWLNMMTHSSHRSHLCEKFMVQLVDCLRIGNSRETNFFMAAVLTAVLQYHLAWVSTVMPAGAAPSRAYLDKHSSKTLDLLAQSHPYNPLWAQLGQTIKLDKLPQHQEQGCIPATVAPPMPTYRVILRDPAADVPNPATSVPPPQLPNTPTQVQLPAPVEANPLPAPPAYGQLTLQELLNSPKEALSSVKEEVGLFIIRQFLAKSQDGATVHLKTGGQPLELVKRTRPRKNTDQVGQKTLRARTKAIAQTRTALSGGAEGTQLKDELKAMGRVEREALLKECLGKEFKITIPQGDILAMKADLGETWYKLRKLRRWFDQWGLASESEKHQRRQVQSITDPENLMCEMVPFEFKKPGFDSEIRETEFGYITDLNRFIQLHLDENEKNGRLTWENAIPEHEVHIKIGGDAGGGTFKMAFQIANLEKPNSKTNTVVFAMFHAKDSWANLKTALLQYKSQVNILKEATWRGKKQVVFLFGDYEFLCKIFGIAGASGKYPCLWCLITYQIMQLSRGDPQRGQIENRSLQNIQADHDRFVADGSCTSRQKFYHNVLHQKLFDIELDKVCVPGLHISLGVFKKLFDDLENQCFELDQKIQIQLAVDSEQLSETIVDEKIVALRAAQQHRSQARQFHEKANSLQELLNLQTLHSHVTIMPAYITTLQSEIKTLLGNAKQEEKLAHDQLELAALEKSEGALTKQLDASLKEMNVERQAYHGKSFIGNHVHTCCKENNITKLCSGVVSKTEELCPSLASQAREISVKFEQLFKLFAACHFVYDSAEYLSDERIDKLEGDIDRFLQFIRQKFPHMAITPKLHMLEDHVCSFLRKWHMGLGFYGEQGIEGIHSEFNNQSEHFDHVKKQDVRLRQILVNHHIATSPTLAGKAPKPKERKLKRKANE